MAVPADGGFGAGGAPLAVRYCLPPSSPDSRWAARIQLVDRAARGPRQDTLFYAPWRTDPRPPWG
ncbi:hypothetical protein ABZT43_44830, partial [Streptomyces sp. NPDC005349]|uniref:hypothetical protein n=1 Tax=Streptomyces sp. NPDC005349 TaxID=3157037 RepID=UPI0033ABDA1A